MASNKNSNWQTRFHPKIVPKLTYFIWMQTEIGEYAARTLPHLT